MFWTLNRGPLLNAAAIVALAFSAGSAVAATLVVRSAGPAAKNYPAGRALAPGKKIVLGATDSVTILDAKGTRTFKGPGSFDAAGTSTSATAGATLAALVSAPTQRRARIGAVRSLSASGPKAPRSDNLWYVEADRSGTRCVTDPMTVTLWRPNMAVAQTYTITGGGKSATLPWRKGQSAQPWPASLPVTSGAEYKVSADGQPAPATVRFAVLGAGDQPLDQLAGKLIAANCKDQLDLLVDTASAPDLAAPQG